MTTQEDTQKVKQRINESRDNSLKYSVNTLIKVCYEDAVKAGWWTVLGTNVPYKRNIPEALCLIHSEISEALEAHRNNAADDKLKHRDGFTVELADALIRIFDLAGGYELDLAGALVEKLEFNRNRQDHKIENRLKENGKKI